MPRSEGYALFVEWQNRLISHEEHFLSRFIESPLAHPSVMFRKNLIEKFGFYHTGTLPEDYELWLRWFDCGASKIGRKRAALLEELGVDIYGFTEGRDFILAG
jgi:hypothetical protein